MTRRWFAVRALVPETTEDTVAELLAQADALGATFEPAADGRLEVVAWSRDRLGARRLVAALGGLGGGEPAIEEVSDRDWMAAYRESAQPFAVGTTWWIDPHPDDPTAAPAGRLRLTIEPRSAFGSGSHESTRLVLLELEAGPPVGLAVLDVGTGSGILALAADRLGATRVVGLDVDLEAVRVARQTAARQETPSRTALFAGPVAAVAPAVRFDRILCNMVSERFVPLLDALAAHLARGGELVLSGLLDSELEAVGVELGRRGLRVVSRRTEAGWACVRAAAAEDASVEHGP